MTSKTTNGLLELQEYIDDIKKDIPEGIYLKICDKIRNIYDKSKKREKKVKSNIKDCIDIIDVEENLQEESNEEESFSYLNLTQKLESTLKQLQFHIEYKLLKKNEYNRYNFEDLKERFNDTYEELC